MKLNTVIPYLKKIKKILRLKRLEKYMNPMTHPLSSADISMFSPEIKKSRNTDIDSILVHNTIPNSFNLSWDFKDCFDKHGYNLDDISKNGYSRPSENQGILKQILWRHNFFLWRHQQNFITWQNYIVDVAMWRKSGNSTISMNEVIITSIL